MTGQDLRKAIRRMTRLPHRRSRATPNGIVDWLCEPRVQWGVLAGLAVLALLIQLVIQLDWRLFGLIAGPTLGAIAAFVGLGRLWGWLVLATGFGLAMGAIPLFGVLGLELSVATALFASLAGADLGCALARELARIPPTGLVRATYPVRTVFRGALAAAGLAIAVALVPAVIAIVRGIFVPTCDWWFGIESYVAMPLASTVLAGATGHAIGALTGPRRIGPAFVAQLPALGVAIAALVRFHQAPPVYTYNAILGYFPGNMYDENVQLQMPLLWSRLEQLAWVAVALAIVAWRFDVASYRVRRAPRPAGGRAGALALAVLAAVCGTALRCNGGSLGFAVDADDLEDALGGRLETPHFTIYYSPTTEIERDLPLIAQDHEFRYAQVVAQLGVAPDHKLVSFYFADQEQKGRLHGSRGVEMAKPWRGEIYLDHRGWPHPSLRHEIAHAIAAEFGDWLFGVASRRVIGLPVLANPGLIEGLAVAVDWPQSYERPNPHELVRVLQKLDKLPSVETLFGLSFFSVSPTTGYTVAGSFMRFLLETHGPAKLREVYHNGGDFERAYGVPLGRLEGEWREMLATIDIPDSVVEGQKEMFRRTSVFARPCAHAIAKRFARAVQLFAQSEKDDAIDLMRRVCSDAPNEPGYQLQLGDMLYSDPAQRDEARAIWQLIAVDDRNVTVSVRQRAFVRLAKVAMTEGKAEQAEQLVRFAQSLPLDPTERRELDAMVFAFAHKGPARPFLLSYFFPKDKDPTPLASATAAIAVEPKLGFAHYLLGLQRAATHDDAAAAVSLETALALPLPGAAFVKNGARKLAVSAYRSYDLPRLRRATTILTGPDMTSGDRLLARDWLDRVEFDTQHPLRATK